MAFRGIHISFVIAVTVLMLLMPASFAMQMSDYLGFERDERKISFAPIETQIKILDSEKFGPLMCSDNKEKFSIIIENPTSEKFDIETIESTVIINGVPRNAAEFVSCSPKEDLVGNEQIDCYFDTASFADEFADPCPPAEPGIQFIMSVTIATERSTKRLSPLIVDTALVDSDIRAEMEISGAMYDVPEVNCVLGSDIEMLVTVNHAEAIKGDIDWTYTINETDKEYSTIECSLVSEGVLGSEGRSDLYSCTMTIPGIAFTDCNEGVIFPVNMTAQIDGEKSEGGFYALTIKEELELRLNVLSTGGDSKCQIVSVEGNKGDCVPKSPQREMLVSVSGNRVDQVETFNYRYSIDGGNATKTTCEKTGSNENRLTFSCNLFLPRRIVTESPDEPGTYGGSSDINVSFDTRYMNIYETISSDTRVSYSGDYKDDSVEIVAKMEKLRDEIKKWENVTKFLKKVLEKYELVKCCCSLGVDLKDAYKSKDKDFFDFLKVIIGKDLSWVANPVESAEEKLDDAINWLTEGNVFVKLVQTSEFMLENILKYGPAVSSCYLSAMKTGYERNLNSFDDFEEGNTPDEYPLTENWGLSDNNGFIDTALSKEFAICVAESLKPKIFCGIGEACEKSLKPKLFTLEWWGNIIDCNGCLAIMVLVITGPLSGFCLRMAAPDPTLFQCTGLKEAEPRDWVFWIKCALKLVDAAIFGIDVFIYLKNREVLELNAKYMNKRMEMQAASQVAMTDYNTAYTSVITDMAAAASTAIGIQALFPPKPEAFISITDSDGALIETGGTVCGHEYITLSYDYTKFEDIDDFVKNIYIYKSEDPTPVNTLSFTENSGSETYDIFDLLDSPVSDDEYEIVFRYGDSESRYRINYREDC